MKKSNKLEYTVDINDLLNLNEFCHVYLIDRENRLLACNQAQYNNILEQIGNVSYESIIGMPLNKIFSDEVIETISQEHQAVYEAQKPLLFYNTWTTFSHKKMSMLTIKTPLYNHQKEIIGIFGISFYLTEIQMDKSNLISFTGMEKEYLTNLLKGKTAKEIAKQLNRSHKTIEDISARIKTKLNCKNKSELINKALDIGVWSSQHCEATSEPYSTGVFIPGNKKQNIVEINK